LSKGSFTPDSLDRARDELFSHIRRCGVLDAETDQRDEWFDDTIQYVGERYPELGPEQLAELRKIGERYCAPAIPQGGLAAMNDQSDAKKGEADTAEVDAAEVDAAEVDVAEADVAGPDAAQPDVAEVVVAEVTKVEDAKAVQPDEVSAA